MHISCFHFVSIVGGGGAFYLRSSKDRYKTESVNCMQTVSIGAVRVWVEWKCAI
jgi:hypothetical protein